MTRGEHGHNSLLMLLMLLSVFCSLLLYAYQSIQRKRIGYDMSDLVARKVALQKERDYLLLQREGLCSPERLSLLGQELGLREPVLPPLVVVGPGMETGYEDAPGRGAGDTSTGDENAKKSDAG